MTTREQITQERLNALLTMIAEDGDTPAGSLPSKDYLAALNKTAEVGQSEDVRQAHREGRGPPDFPGPSGNDNPGEGPQKGGGN